MTDQNLSVLVISCDKYSDLWPYFFSLFEVRWPDCPYPVWLGSNDKVWSDRRVRPICVGADTTWAANVRAMLQAIETPYVLPLLEDFFLTDPVLTGDLAGALNAAISLNADCLRVTVSRRSLPKNNTVRSYAGTCSVGEILPGTPYRVSTQAAIWKKSALLAMLDEDYSAWDFEIIGSQVAERLPVRIYGVSESIIKYRHAVERGKWLPQGIENCQAAGLTIDFTKRPALSAEEFSALLNRSRTLRSTLSRYCVPEFIRRLRQQYKSRAIVDRFRCRAVARWSALPSDKNIRKQQDS